MKIQIDNQKYEERSKAFLEWLSKWIESSFEGIEPIDKDAKEELTEMLLFNMACLLDGTGNLQCGDKSMVPYLGFLLDGEEQVIFDDQRTMLHELIDEG